MDLREILAVRNFENFAHDKHMEEEIKTGSRLVDLNENNSDNKMKVTVDVKNNELNENNIKNEKHETRKVEDKAEDLCVGMLFGSIDDIMKYYTSVAFQSQNLSFYALGDL
ncbi:hypothetical protein CFP56_010687 [Quercus suber]|uniref:Uncharacterized protein n=1 Tax=Quercus suber TaxID=58331 RepID=A0AAW0KYW2_QUESU